MAAFGSVLAAYLCSYVGTPNTESASSPREVGAAAWRPGAALLAAPVY